MGLIFKWICSFLTSERVGMLMRKLILGAATAAAAQIMDPENQKKAYEFVKALRKDKTMTNHEKAQTFNLQMLVWAKKVGKVMSDSVINCLRELAVNSLKVEREERRAAGLPEEEDETSAN